jgi:hypothetical protein
MYHSTSTQRNRNAAGGDVETMWNQESARAAWEERWDSVGRHGFPSAYYDHPPQLSSPDDRDIVSFAAADYDHTHRWPIKVVPNKRDHSFGSQALAVAWNGSFANPSGEFMHTGVARATSDPRTRMLDADTAFLIEQQESRRNRQYQQLLLVQQEVISMDRAIEDMAVQRDTATKLYQEAALGNSQPETSGHVVMTKHNMQRMLEDGLKATDFGQSVGPDAVSHFYEFTLSSNLRGLNILPKYFEMAVGDVLLPREMAAHVHADSGRPLTLFHREDGSLEITTDQPLARLGWVRNSLDQLCARLQEGGGGGDGFQYWPDRLPGWNGDGQRWFLSYSTGNAANCSFTVHTPW